MGKHKDVSITIQYYPILFIVSLYLSFKVNNGFEITSFIASIFVPFIYIPYILWREGLDFLWIDSEHHEEE
jgi:hypothetical protein